MSNRLGFDDAQIAGAGIVLSVSLLLWQIPSGVIADRWSRRGMLIVSSLFLLASTVLGAVSNSLPAFYVVSFLWGMFSAGASGLDDTLVYDIIQEEGAGANSPGSSSKGFEHYYGRLQIYDSAAFVASALASSLVSSQFGLRATFWFSVPFVLASFFFAWRLREPLIHTHNQSEQNIIKHTRQTFKAITVPAIFKPALPLIIFLMLSRLVVNMPQLWYLALAVPTALYGPAYAILHFCGGIAGATAKLFRSRLALALLVICLVGAALILRTHSFWLIVFAQTVLLTGYGIACILLNKQVHDLLPSAFRAGSSSVLASASQLLFLPVAYFFGRWSTDVSIFQASWIVILFTIGSALLLLLNGSKLRQRSYAEGDFTEIEAEQLHTEPLQDSI